MVWTKRNFTNGSGEALDAEFFNAFQDSVVQAHPTYSATAPTSPATGQLWIDPSDTGGSSVQRGIIRPEDYGAVGDGTTDDTTAVQSAATAAISSGLCLLFAPGGEYRITSTLVLDTGTQGFNPVDFSVLGWGATLILDANNAPVMRLTGENPHGFLIEGLRLKHATAQASTNTESYGIRFDSTWNGTTLHGSYNFTIRGIKFENVFRALGNFQTGARPVWGMWIEACDMASNTSGAFLYHNASTGSSPNIHIQDCYINRTSTQELSIYMFACGSVQIENMEINSGTGMLMRFTSCSTISIQHLTTEGCIIPDSVTDWQRSYLLFEDTDFDVQNSQFTSCAFAGTTGTRHAIFAGYGSAPHKKGLIRRVGMWTDTTPTTTPYIFAAPTSSTDFPNDLEFSSLFTGTNINDYDATAAWVPACLRYDSSRGTVGSVSTVQSIDTAGTIAVAKRDTIIPVNPSSNAAKTGVILAAGTYAGQQIKVIHRNAFTQTLTFNTTTATSRVSETTYVMSANRSYPFTWDASLSRWVPDRVSG